MKSRILPYGRAAAALLPIAFTLLPSGPARASRLSELPSVLVITKSSNRNEVHYAEAVDEACAPAGAAPIRPYWRMLEDGPTATEPLNEREDSVLGVARQSVAGETVEFALRGMPDRAFAVHSSRAADGRCSSWVGATIAGTPARLSGFYVKQKLFGTIDYVQLSGVAANGKAVRERIEP